jgi:hypothetical protein
VNLSHRGVWREAHRRMLPSDVYSLFAGVRIGPVPSPSMILAFMDGVDLLQHGYCPASICSDRWSSLFRLQHDSPTLNLAESFRPETVPARLNFIDRCKTDSVSSQVGLMPIGERNSSISKARRERSFAFEA